MKLRVDQCGTITGLVEMNPGDRAVISQIHGGQTIVEILKRYFGAVSIGYGMAEKIWVEDD